MIGRPIFIAVGLLALSVLSACNGDAEVTTTAPRTSMVAAKHYDPDATAKEAEFEPLPEQTDAQDPKNGLRKESLQ